MIANDLVPISGIKPFAIKECMASNCKTAGLEGLARRLPI
jgi:hypothetical protein